eukprot:13716944-Heterocapsa_arctica.AAC.1
MAFLRAVAIPLFSCRGALVGLDLPHLANNTTALAGFISDASAVKNSGAIFSIYHVLLKLGVSFGVLQHWDRGIRGSPGGSCSRA